MMTQPVLTGSLDVSRAQELRDLAARIVADAQEHVTIDCEGVERIDAAAAQVLLALARALRHRGHRLELGALPERPTNLLKVTGFGALLGESNDHGERNQEEVNRD